MPISAKNLIAGLVVASLHMMSSSSSMAQVQTSDANMKKAQEYYKAGDTARLEKRYADAAQLLLKSYELVPASTDLPYDIACLHALRGVKDEAFKWLDAAIAAGYTNVEHMLKDSDFDSLHDDPRWEKSVSKTRQEAARQARLWSSPVWNSAYAEQLSEDDRVAGLSRFWSEVKYNFVYTDKLLDLDWDAVFLRYLPKVRAAKNTADYYKVLMEMCALLQDGHTNVMAPAAVFNDVWGMVPLRAALMEDKVIITEVLDPALRERGILPGHQILSADGQDIKTYVRKEVAPYISASTPQDLNTRLYNYFLLFGALDTPVKMLVADSQGKTISIDVKRINTMTRRKLDSPRPAFNWRMLANNIAYVELNSFGDDTAANEYLKAYTEIAKAKAIIFDVRKNGGGSSDVGYKVLRTLGTSPFDGSHAATRDYKPAWRAWGKKQSMHDFADEKINPDPARAYHGKVVVLTSAATYSAAEDFAVAFDSMKRGLIIGEATGGSTGQPLLISLPGGGSARICTKKDTYVGGKVFVGVGVQPDKLIQTKIEDFRAGKDTQLNAAQEEIEKLK
ncbi:S41 family peptidase [Undibacterium sp. TS12]|uniref:S41 family peptidase n=1 Tax=Undibacterium sp. TS12 TaxID=2908202 RepID=UPI001F4C609D|nr:S41 family peptidase [Undibacterium sp. TS12]MCH8622417.1 S41 family peptidase [Undibacterium sp. TS12]